MRKLFLLFALSSLFIITACGSKGGGGGSTAVQLTTAKLKLSTSGSLPAGTLIGGIDVTIVLPDGVSAMSTTAPITDSGVVTASGLATPSSATVMGKYSAASGATHGNVRVLLAYPNGLTKGEFATVNCEIASGNVPTEDQFIINATEVKDINGVVITGMSVTREATIQ